MLSNITRLFGQRPAVSGGKEGGGNHGDGDLPGSQGSCQPSSSKKQRVENDVYLPGRDNTLAVKSSDDLDKVQIKEEVIDEVIDDNANEQSVQATESHRVSYRKISELESQLRISKANFNLLQDSVSAPLICTSCKQLPRTLPLLSCTNHHKTCNNCTSSKLSTCTACSKPLCEESSPLLDSLLSSLNRSCTWSDLGCSFQSVLEQLLDHEKTCKYQTVLCWGCEERYSLRAFDKHDPNLACFSDKVVYKSSAEKTLLLTLPKFKGQFPLQYPGDCEWNPIAIKYAGKMFYVRIKRIHNRGVWIFYTAAQMLPASCQNYVATITLSSPDMYITTTTWTYTGSPSSLIQGLDSVLKEGKCLIMTDPAMEQLMTVDKLKKGTLFTIAVELSLKK